MLRNSSLVLLLDLGLFYRVERFRDLAKDLDNLDLGVRTAWLLRLLPLLLLRIAVIEGGGGG